MAVPKRRTSQTRKKKRRTHQKLSAPNLSRDPVTGNYHRSHRVDKDGYYRGEQVIKPKQS
ncbi:50S ribosomal protein L32 [Sporolactobacillus pectinivorans]|uniref:50S ribosomal protein L32 n=1 Tax=Sporolactobacillus pectinivorans TaxID=1591408 RepID=UPI000C25810D|nr:50S ribosomal protein L32 [Sporolactobacillus pectinivorans]